MRDSIKNFTKRGTLALLAAGLLLAASSAAVAAEALIVRTSTVSPSTIVVEVFNTNDVAFSGVVNLQVVVSGSPTLVPVPVSVAAGSKTTLVLDLAQLSVGMTDESPVPF